MGNSKDLQKEIATLEQIKNSMVKIYKTKFDLTEEEIDKMLEAETWIDVDNYKDWKLNCKVVANGEPLKIAASISSKHFKNIPTRILNMTSNEETVKAEEKPVDEEEKKEEVVDVSAKAETKEEPSEEKEEKKEEKEETSEPEEKKPTYDELESRISELVKENEDLKKQLAECGGGEKKKDSANEETVTKAECEKRVSGMQASMQKQVNKYVDEINDFQNQLTAKNEELTKAKAEITSLKDSLEKASEELSKTASALEEKNKALEMLNSNVNAKSEEEIPTMAEGLAKCASPAEKVAFLKSGRYVR